MIVEAGEALAAALEALQDHGLLLSSDQLLPSVVGLIVGGPLRSSWWGHPLGGVIYRVSNDLDEHPDVLTTKLIAGKVTYVHRRLWPALLSVATAREPWQLARLSPAARWLLTETDSYGEIHTNEVPPPPHTSRKALPDGARELERRLLLHSAEIHTPSGAHAKVLETWPRWAARAGVSFASPLLPATLGKRELEEAAEGLAAGTRGHLRLPWLAS
jgi:hypothetical protein